MWEFFFNNEPSPSDLCIDERESPSCITSDPLVVESQFNAIAVSSTVEGSTGPVVVSAPIERESVIRHTEKTNQYMSQCVIRDSATSSQCGRPNSRKRNPYKPRRRSPSKAKAISSCEPYIADSLMVSTNAARSEAATQSTSSSKGKSTRPRSKRVRFNENEALTNQPPSETHQSESKPLMFPKILSADVVVFEHPPANSPFRFLANLVLQQQTFGNEVLPSNHQFQTLLPLCDITDEWALVWVDPIPESGFYIADGIVVSREILDLEISSSNRPGLSSHVALKASEQEVNSIVRQGFGIYSLYELRNHVFIGPYVAGYLFSVPSTQCFKIISEKTIQSYRFSSIPIVIELDSDSPDASLSNGESTAIREEICSSQQPLQSQVSFDDVALNPGNNGDTRCLGSLTNEMDNGCSSEEIEFIGVFPRVKSEIHQEETEYLNSNNAEASEDAFLLPVAANARSTDPPQNFETPHVNRDCSPLDQNLMRTLKLKEEKANTDKMFQYLEIIVAPGGDSPVETILNKAINTIKRCELRSQELTREYQTLLNQQKFLEKQRETLFSDLPPNILPLYTSFFTPSRIPERHTIYNNEDALN